MYPNSFNSKSKTLLRTIAKDEYKIDYKNLSYKKCSTDGNFHEFSFLTRIWYFI